MQRLPRQALLIVALVTAFRIVVAARVPLTEDEAYYWSWSKHLAFGYLDHPPAVAWLIASMSWLGQSPLVVRLPFIVCEALAALAVGSTAMLLSNDARSGTPASVLFILLPQPRFALGEALPDGPYMLCWALALWLTARAVQHFRRRDMLYLGLALGGALISRYFGWALVAGIVMFMLAPQRRALWKRGFWIALTVALLLYVPVIAWNATHGWENLNFTLRYRLPFHAFSLERPLYFSTFRTQIFAIVIWIVAYYTTIRPKYSLLGWTALPLTTLFVFLSFFQIVESYWLLGPFTSLCAAIGIAYAKLQRALRRVLLAVWAVPAAYTMAAVLFWALPEPAQATVLKASGDTLKGPLYSPVSVDRKLAADIRALAQSKSAAVLTDRYELASELLYYGVQTLIVGPSPQVNQWYRWYHDGPLPQHVLVLTIGQLQRGDDISRRLTRAFTKIRRGPDLHYTFAGTSAATFYTTWCEQPRREASIALFGR